MCARQATAADGTAEYDYSSNIPDECLAIIFQSLCSADRKRCSVVCRRWMIVEGQSRHRMAFNAHADIIPFIPSLFTRFDSVTKLALQCDRKSNSVDDDALVLVSLRCPNLTRLKLRGCRDVSDVGMATLAKNCKSLKKFSCGSCMFGAKGMNALLNNCSSLEELSVKRLRGLNDGGNTEPIGPGLAASSLKSICLKELYNGQCFAPLIIGSKKLKTLKLISCLGQWDGLLRTICSGNDSLTEIRLEKLQVSDVGLEGLSNCSNLEVLHLIKAIECTDSGVATIAGSCKMLRKLHIDGWRTNRIGDEGIIAVAKHGLNLQELVLIGLNPSIAGIAWISLCCTKLERLAICASDTIGDREISCIAAKTLALKKLCIKGCRLLTDDGIISFAHGCPNLVKIKVKKCKRVTGGALSYLRAKRPGLELSLDVIEEVAAEVVDASASDGGAQEGGGGSPPRASCSEGSAYGEAPAEPSENAGRFSGLRSTIGLLGGSLVASTLRRWSSDNGNSNNNNNNDDDNSS